MKVSIKQQIFINRIHQSCATFSAAEVAEIIEEAINITSGDDLKDEIKAITTCEGMIERGYTDSQILAAMRPRQYVKRLVKNDPAAVTYILETARSRLQLKAKNN